MGPQDFLTQLRDLGFVVEEIASDKEDKATDKIAFKYTVPVGKFAGQTVTLGFVVPSDFPTTPPGGPHVSPRILPLNPGAAGHPERVAESGPFGEGWEYWSRPFPNWKDTDRTATAYMAFIRRLFATQ